MSNDYILLKRNNYVDEHMNKKVETVTKVSFEKKSLVNYLTKVTPLEVILSDLDRIKDIDTINSFFCYENKFSPEEQELLKNKELLEKIIKFKKNLISANELDIDAKKKFENF